MKAKTLHIEFEAAPSGERREEKMRGEVKIGEGGAFHLKIVAEGRSGPREEMVLRSDGRVILSSPPGKGVDLSNWKPQAVEKCLRRAATSGNFLAIYLVMARGVDPEKAFEEFAPKEVKAEGKEKLGAVEATKVSFAVDLVTPRPQRLDFQLWIDADKLTILKRAISVLAKSIEETTARFELNAPFPADFFEFQSATMLQEGRAIQLARSVALFARYTGRLPKTLEDLARRPSDLPASTFWPQTGFWIGGAISKDIPYSSDATHFTVGTIREPIPVFSPVGAPTDRLAKYFSARVGIQLLKAAAAGFSKATSAMPKDPLELAKKPESVRYWPEGGWIGGGRLPVDPWGDPYVIQAGSSFSVSIAKPGGRMLKLSDVTPEERKGLEVAAQPPLTDKDAAEVAQLMKQLGAGKRADREAATQAIIAKGGGAVKLVIDRLADEKDPEVAARLGVIRDHFKSVRTTWELEMKGMRFGLSGTGADPAMIPNNERMGSNSLKTLTTAQADFRSNDRDGNKANDFYAQDVAGLYALKPATGADTEAKAGEKGEARLVNCLIEPSLAKADTTEDRWEYPVLEITEPEPKAGYFFASLKNHESNGKAEPYHKGSGRNNDMFGFVAYPAEYGVTGRRTFIVNEDNTIWQKDLGGEEIDVFPKDPAAAGWRKMD